MRDLNTNVKKTPSPPPQEQHQRVEDRSTARSNLKQKETEQREYNGACAERQKKRNTYHSGDRGSVINERDKPKHDDYKNHFAISFCFPHCHYTYFWVSALLFAFCCHRSEC